MLSKIKSFLCSHDYDTIRYIRYYDSSGFNMFRLYEAKFCLKCAKVEHIDLKRDFGPFFYSDIEEYKMMAMIEYGAISEADVIERINKLKIEWRNS